MRIILFILAILPAMIPAQTLDVSYSIDTVGGKDSFFLVETISRTISESPRPQSTTTSILFRDTAEFSAYILRMQTDRANLSTRITQMQAQLTLLESRLVVIQDLRDSVMPLISSVQQRVFVTPPPQSPLKTPTRKPDQQKATLSKKGKKKG